MRQALLSKTDQSQSDHAYLSELPFIERGRSYAPLICFFISFTGSNQFYKTNSLSLDRQVNSQMGQTDRSVRQANRLTGQTDR